YYVSDVTKCGTVRVELGSGGVADVNELSWPLSGLVNGWNQISLNTIDASQIGTPNMSALNWFRIYDTKTASITTRIDAIEVMDSSTPPSSQRKGVKTNKAIIEEPSQQGMSVKIYPNPYRQGILSLDITGFESMNDVKIKATNLLGQVIHQENATDKSHQELNLSGKLSESVYFISVESGETKLVKRLIVK
ncbi:MAG: T9SS type A sorting domain-containing protein, partial [Flavobacterium sp.]|nr:T9SS type A sorting domain-containing protein [Flavobacterium sp.]